MIVPAAIEFAILTAARSSEVVGATWSEMDQAAKLWTVPASRMKAKRPHVSPLSNRAVQILGDLPREEDNPRVFLGVNRWRGIGRAMIYVLRCLQPGDITMHGFRSSMSTWAREETDHAVEVIEAALAHSWGDAVMKAYARGSAIDKRRRLMGDWANFVSGRDKVVHLRSVGT
jgi:integrase